MIRPVGAFLHFAAEPPAALRNTTYAAFGLTPDSFRMTDRDPLAALRGVPSDVLTTLTGEVGCLTCHTFRSAGARSHHIQAADGRPSGGYGLALEEYPPDVLRRFLFDQNNAADTIGVGPLMVPGNVAAQPQDLVAGEVTRRTR